MLLLFQKVSDSFHRLSFSFFFFFLLLVLLRFEILTATIKEPILDQYVLSPLDSIIVDKKKWKVEQVLDSC